MASTSENHSKTKECVKELDRLKATAAESGGSSQCDTPPLAEKDAGPSQSKFTGVSPESVQCMAEQVGANIGTEAAANLAEDATYKLRQLISTIAIHGDLMMKTSIDSCDVNTALTLTDSGPVVGAATTQYKQFGIEKLCYPVEELVDVCQFALTPQTFTHASPPTLAAEWITEESSLNANSNISATLHNYYTHIARALLNHRKKIKEVAVADLMTNTKIGPIFPNFFNLAILVLNDENLNAFNVPEKKPLQSNILDMVDALCSNPCGLDTNIQNQFQRLFPVMVSHILGNGPLAEKMVAVLTKIIRTWPSFIIIGEAILFEYLSQGIKERLTAPIIKCMTALGRSALVKGLGNHLDHLDRCIHSPRRSRMRRDFWDTILDAATCLLRAEPTTYLEDYVITDYSLYEMLGDSVLPRRMMFPKKEQSNLRAHSTDKQTDKVPHSRRLRPLRLRRIETVRPHNSSNRDSVFEPTKLHRPVPITIRIPNSRIWPVINLNSPVDLNSSLTTNSNPRGTVDRGVVIAGGFMYKYKYKITNECQSAPHYATMML